MHVIIVKVMIFLPVLCDFSAVSYFIFKTGTFSTVLYTLLLGSKTLFAAVFCDSVSVF